MNEQTHNAGEKCPACKGGGYVPMPQAPVGAVSPSPAAEVKEREVEELAKTIHEIGSSTIAWNLVDEGWHDDRRKIAQWHLSDLTTKLAALQVEKEADMRSFNEASNIAGEIAKNLRTEITTLRAENQGQERQMLQIIEERDEAQEAISQAYYLVIGESPEWSNLFVHQQAIEEIDAAQRLLRETIQSQAKEVERLRELLKLACDKGHLGNHSGHWDVTMRHGKGCNICIDQREVIATMQVLNQEALKPTPEDKP